MKHLSYLTLTALLSISACSHFKKDCCAHKSEQKECCKEQKECCKKKEACCKKEAAKDCKDGHCEKQKAEADAGQTCHKKS